MSSERSRYRPTAPPDYSHRFHAGNVGDVWKHIVLVEVLGRIAAAARARYLDTHAGEGRYPLGPTGEWTEGIGRLWAEQPADHAGPVGVYLTLCHRLARDGPRPDAYPGSPLFARAVLGAHAPLALWERDPAARARLATALEDDAAVTLVGDDGLRTLPDAVQAAEAAADVVVVLVDPPYSQKADWTAVPAAVATAAAASRRATIVLWYPVKSLTRPNAMVARLKDAGVSATLIELVTTPLEHQRHRLNGSGVLLVRPPEGTPSALAGAAAVLGMRLATRSGVWSLRLLSW